MRKRLSDVWCKLMHEQAMWPIHGRYECRTCGRQHPVAWAEPETGQAGQRRRPVARDLSAARTGGFLTTNGARSCG